MPRNVSSPPAEITLIGGFLVCLLVTAMNIPAHAAANWVQVGNNPDYAILVDLGSITMMKGTNGKIEPHTWISRKYYKPAKGSNIWYYNEWWEIRCDAGEVVVHDSISYDSANIPQKTYSKHFKRMIKPGTYHQLVYDEVCGYLKKPVKKKK